MAFFKRLVSDLLTTDGVLVIGKGLGMHETAARFVRLYAKNKDHLVFVLNGSAQLYETYRELLLVGSKRAVLKNFSFVDATVSQAERARLYRRGGCIFITSRILVVDLLMRRIDPELVSGLLVLDAHRVSESTTTGFVIRIYRRDNHVGFVKGFSDNPHAFMAGFGKTEKLMRSLFVRKLHLWPRFHLHVAECLEACAPVVEELSMPMHPGMARVQKLLLKLIDACVVKIKGSLTEADLSDITVEQELSRSFDQYLRRRLDPYWHHISQAQRQLLNDIKTLRNLALKLMSVDCVTFLRMVDLVKQTSIKQVTKSFWLFIDAADDFFDAAMERVFRIEGGGAVSEPRLELQMEQPRKWKELLDVLREIKQQNGLLPGEDPTEVPPPQKKAKRQKQSKKKSRGGATANTSHGSDDGNASAHIEPDSVRVLIFVQNDFSKELVCNMLAKSPGAFLRENFDEYLIWHHHRTLNHRKAVEARRRAGGSAQASRIARALWAAFDKRYGQEQDAAGNNDGAAGAGLSGSLNPEAASIDFWLKKGQNIPGLVAAFPQWRENVVFVWEEQRGDLDAIEEAMQNLEQKIESLPDHAETTTDSGGGGGGGGGNGKPVHIRKHGVNDSIKMTSDDEVEANSVVAQRRGCKFFLELLAFLRSECVSVEGAPRRQASASSSKTPQNRKSRRIPKNVTLAELDDTGKAGASSSQDWLDACELPLTQPSASSKPIGFAGRIDGYQAPEGGGSERDTLPRQHPTAEHSELLDGLEIVVQSLDSGSATERAVLLHELAPEYIIIFDPDVEVIRQIEVHQTRGGLHWQQRSASGQGLFSESRSNQNPGNVRKVYLLTYENSVQELLYINSATMEQQAFRKLINESARIVMPEQIFPPKIVPGSESSSSAGGAVSSRVGGGVVNHTPDKIVVDMREFRSALPSILHARGLEIVPVTLEVGDYVLSPELCVERKSISDLYGSFKSGRLHTQATVMCRHYQNPILLIEFEEGKKFGFQSSARLGEKVSAGDITSKLVLLTRHFPRLRLFWSANPHATVDFFQCLRKSGPPDAEKAAAVKVSEAEHIEGGTVDIVAREVFAAIPGADGPMALRNVQKLASTEERDISLADLASMSLPDLVSAFGKAKGRRMFDFLNYSVD